MPNLTPSMIVFDSYIHVRIFPIAVTALTYWSSFTDGYILTLPKNSSEQDCVDITAPMVDHDEMFTYNYKAEKFLDGTGLVQVPKGFSSITVINGRCV